MIGPWFVNWNSYKTSFEAEAEKILGRPVVIGSAKATLLPSPSLTFEDVTVGDGDGEPMLEVARFSVAIELMPLLQGEFHVVSMLLDRPRMRIVVDGDGLPNWQMRGDRSTALDPEKFILEGIEIVDGRIEYEDQAGENEFSFEGIKATVEASSLLGPWRVDGRYEEEGGSVEFGVATGRRLDNGTIRVKTESSPAGWPVKLASDGIVSSGEDGVSYDGTYSVAEIVPDVSMAINGEFTGIGKPIGWRSEGTFKLTQQQLAITKAVLMDGPPERPYSLAGSLMVEFGLDPRFEARASARQIDLDRSLGNEAREPVEVTAAVGNVVDWLADSFVPPIPGSIFFSVPDIVVADAVIQDVAFEARKTIGGWRLASFSARLPGHATLSASGVLATELEVSFAGDVHLVVSEPATFAKWWRGRSEESTGWSLPPFVIGARAELAKGRFVFEDIDALIGEAAIAGRVAWSEVDGRRYRRILETEITANSVDVAQLKALVELVTGGDLAQPGLPADQYEIKLDVGTFRLDDVTINNVAIDASVADDAVIVNEFEISDLDGARLDVTEGRIDGLAGRPQGSLEAQLDAESLVGITRVVEHLLPGHALTEWLKNAAPSLTPAFLNASIEAPARGGDADFHIRIGGQASATKLSANFDISGALAEWPQAETTASIKVESTDAAELARQVGILTGAAGASGGAELRMTATGVPANGMKTEIIGRFAGIGVRSNGGLTLTANLPPAFVGSINAQSDDLEPLMDMAGLEIPGAAPGNSARIAGEIAVSGLAVNLTLNDSQVAGRRFAGAASFSGVGDGSWRADGDLHIDALDLGWIAALGLGFGLEPTGEAGMPWSPARFGRPGFGSIRGKVSVAADQLRVTEGFDAAAVSLVLDLEPDRVSVDVLGGEFVGGTMSGALSIHNVGGNASVSGRITLKDAALGSLVWWRDDQAVASGKLDLSASFEAAGSSPAVLLSSLTGAGAIVIRDGEARYINPLALRPLIEASDLDEDFPEAELLDALTKQIDGGSLAFEDLEGAFAIAGGVVRLTSLVVDSDTTLAFGDAAIDLAALAIDSDWTIVFNLGDDAEEGVPPQIGMAFRGPLTDPKRTIDVVPLGAYLSIRQEARLLQILKQAEVDRRENDRLKRRQRKLREDSERRAQEAALVNAARSAADEESATNVAEDAEGIAALIEEVREVTEAGVRNAIDRSRNENLRAARSIAASAASQALEAAEGSTNGLSAIVPLPPPRPPLPTP